MKRYRTHKIHESAFDDDNIIDELSDEYITDVNDNNIYAAQDGTYEYGLIFDIHYSSDLPTAEHKLVYEIIRMNSIVMNRFIQSDTIRYVDRPMVLLDRMSNITGIEKYYRPEVWNDIIFTDNWKSRRCTSSDIIKYYQKHHSFTIYQRFSIYRDGDTPENMRDICIEICNIMSLIARDVKNLETDFDDYESYWVEDVMIGNDKFKLDNDILDNEVSPKINELYKSVHKYLFPTKPVEYNDTKLMPRMYVQGGLINHRMAYHYMQPYFEPYPKFEARYMKKQNMIIFDLTGDVSIRINKQSYISPARIEEESLIKYNLSTADCISVDVSKLCRKIPRVNADDYMKSVVDFIKTKCRGHIKNMSLRYSIQDMVSLSYLVKWANNGTYEKELRKQIDPQDTVDLSELDIDTLHIWYSNNVVENMFPVKCSPKTKKDVYCDCMIKSKLSESAFDDEELTNRLSDDVVAEVNTDPICPFENPDDKYEFYMDIGSGDHIDKSFFNKETIWNFYNRLMDLFNTYNLMEDFTYPYLCVLQGQNKAIKKYTNLDFFMMSNTLYEKEMTELTPDLMYALTWYSKWRVFFNINKPRPGKESVWATNFCRMMNDITNVINMTAPMMEPNQINMYSSLKDRTCCQSVIKDSHEFSTILPNTKSWFKMIYEHLLGISDKQTIESDFYAMSRFYTEMYKEKYYEYIRIAFIRFTFLPKNIFEFKYDRRTMRTYIKPVNAYKLDVSCRIPDIDIMNMCEFDFTELDEVTINLDSCLYYVGGEDILHTINGITYMLQNCYKKTINTLRLMFYREKRKRRKKLPEKIDISGLTIKKLVITEMMENSLTYSAADIGSIEIVSDYKDA